MGGALVGLGTIRSEKKNCTLTEFDTPFLVTDFDTTQSLDDIHT